MIGGNILTVFGSLNGTIDGATVGAEFLAFELSQGTEKRIRNIDASFQFASGSDKTTQPFGISRLVVIKKPLDTIPITVISPFQVIPGVDILFDKNIFDYDGVSIPCFFKAGKTEVLSVILFPMFNAAGAVTSRRASLTVQGDEGGSANSKLRVVN